MQRLAGGSSGDSLDTRIAAHVARQRFALSRDLRRKKGMSNESHRLTRPAETNTRAYPFDHHRLDAYRVALEALVVGEGIARELPRGYGKLKDQLQRALQGAFLQTAEAASRSGADRRSRFRCARAEAGEAAAALEALQRLELVSASRVEPVVALLWRLCAMLHRLGLR